MLAAVSVFDMIGKDAPTPLGMLLILLAMMIATLALTAKSEENEKIRDKKAIRSGKIKLTDKALDYEGKDYIEMRNVFYNLGFTNVRFYNAHDLTLGIFKKSGSVFDIVINGGLPSKTKWYDANSKIVIKYHDFPE